MRTVNILADVACVLIAATVLTGATLVVALSICNIIVW